MPDTTFPAPTCPTQVEFGGISLLAFTAEDGQLYVSLRQLCQQLGLHYPSEMRRIRAMPALAEGLHDLNPHLPECGIRKTPYLPVELVPGWLIGVNTQQVREPTLRQKLLACQQEMGQLAWQIFGPTLALEPELAKLTQRIERLSQRLEEIRKRINREQASD
jgi:hypothetical protein